MLVRYTLVHRKVNGAASFRPNEFNKCTTNSIFELLVRTLYTRDLTLSWFHTLSKYNTFQSWPCW